MVVRKIVKEALHMAVSQADDGDAGRRLRSG